jgi:hypothetical protein
LLFTSDSSLSSSLLEHFDLSNLLAQSPTDPVDQMSVELKCSTMSPPLPEPIACDLPDKCMI